jgi:endo-alpha-1,4-polygalactosaminidase (GH114 family)
MRLLVTLVLILLALPAEAETWRPAPGASIQLQYTGETIDRGIDAGIYDLDLFETPPNLIADLKAEGRHVICYMSVGTLEDWRPDRAAFPATVIGKAYPQWPGENWLDLRAIDLLAPALTARLDLARAKGCDGIDPDNLDGYEAESGFPLTRADTVRFMRWLSQEARQRGLALGLKNGADLRPELEGAVDWVLIEDCAAQGWCAAFASARASGLAVFQVEYTDEDLDWNAVCRQAAELGFSAIRKHRNLDAYLETCP